MILGIGEPAHERSRQDGRDTEQVRCQPYDHSIPTQRGDKNGDVGKRKKGKSNSLMEFQKTGSYECVPALIV
jgi:hypothetical protein